MTASTGPDTTVTAGAFNAATMGAGDPKKPPGKAVIGIVGGIGAGKSTVAAELVQLGCARIDGDAIGHALLADPEVRRQIRQRWGEGVFSPEGDVRRDALGEIVFADAAELRALGEILHPRIRRGIEEQIARARFAIYGKAVYPDATFTLRLTFGPARGYPMNGTLAPYKTTLYGLFDRAISFDREGDFQLPRRFWDRADRLDLATPVNFVCVCDITGGNSGSPVITRKAELAGIVFDGNIESLPNEFIYDPVRSRAVAVHSAYVLEALRKLYDAGHLADEIDGSRKVGRF